MNALKISILVLSIILISPTPNQAQRLDEKHEITWNKASIKWKVEEIDLGEIAQSKPVTVEFEFKNSGDTPIMITNVQTSCGCTGANYEKTPILPGKSTKIAATYNAASKGNFKKTITVTTNADDLPKVLTIKGTVI